MIWLSGSTLLEQRYLAGHSSLCDDAARAWADLDDQVERLGGLAELLPPAAGAAPSAAGAAPSAAASLDEEVAHRVDARASWLADDARVKAFELLDERARAAAVMERRLRNGPTRQAGP